ncbi:MAG TPA: hypothetical protein VIK07_12595 [Bacteroidales bacterium]
MLEWLFQISVWSSNGNRKIVLINPALDGSYSTELVPGDYLVILDKEQNMAGSSNLPMEVSIKSRDKTILNINIDTGIR